MQTAPQTEFFKGQHFDAQEITEGMARMIGEFLASGGRMVFFGTVDGTIRSVWIEQPTWAN